MRQRLSGEARRDEILQATVELVGERGHQAVRVIDVARKLSVSAGLVMYHFGTKEALLAAAFASEAGRDLEAARAILAQSGHPTEALVKLTAWYLPTSAGARSWRLWLDGWAASQFDEQFASVIRACDDDWRELFATAVRACSDRGLARAVEPGERGVAAATEQLVSFMNGLVVRRLTAPQVIPDVTLTEWVREYLVRQLEISLDAT
ncbi:TetR/AcrR family transcriptional regulator [Leucobacter sp. HY1908]